MIGGGNYLEYESLATWAGRATPPKSIVYGATDLLTDEQARLLRALLPPLAAGECAGPACLGALHRTGARCAAHPAAGDEQQCASAVLPPLTNNARSMLGPLACRAMPPSACCAASLTQLALAGCACGHALRVLFSMHGSVPIACAAHVP